MRLVASLIAPDLRTRSGSRVGVWIVGVLVWIASIPLHAQQMSSPVGDTSAQDTALSRVVVGIVSYTRWPQARSPVRLCIVGGTRFSPGSLNQAEAASSPPIDVQRKSPADAALGADCDALYIGSLSLAERRQVDATRAGRPILTISEVDSACTSGAMFCLNLDADRVTFDMNLDNVARSGVRVSPKVLELAHKRSAP
jgi:hypothetical protein